ncbi:hypothetical protein DEU56DRAFT_946308 [Suillus clintonianus]|uniref:uncharacterized protein n=1 Tax=Suillus clintonianus TaxID=1904413 RepID=UPI001B885234|nr:uncharacterized protein DEU56DRAFT_946308 [Suillus clintonianus]KAG2137017.1 hypothetical protein DEU56DRAFT_946308 [Suillus clintonianus]
MSVAISPDGKHIVSGSRDKTIRVWDLEFLNRHQLFASAICFSPDPSHALHSASSFLSDSEAPAPYGLNEEGDVRPGKRVGDTYQRLTAGLESCRTWHVVARVSDAVGRVIFVIDICRVTPWARTLLID